MPAKTYRVCGTLPVFGNAPDTTFTCDIDPETETRLIASGSIREVTPAVPTVTTNPNDGRKAKET